MAPLGLWDHILQSNRTNRPCIQQERFILGNWLMQFWGHRGWQVQKPVGQARWLENQGGLHIIV